ncbi:MAG: ParA family protein [Syntrophobacteraceae bacterium]
MACVISFVSEKGGVGKTTALFHIAVGLRRHKEKYSVLVVDTDYQRGGLTCRLRPEMLEHFRLGEVNEFVTIYHAYRVLYSGEKTLPSLSVLDTKWGIDLVPADPRLNTVSVDKMPSTNNIRDNNRMLMRHLTLIADCLKERQTYDFILLDSHPDLHDLEKAVIFASDYCVSPVKLDNQSSVGVPSTVEAIKNVDADVIAVGTTMGIIEDYKETVFLGALPMMCRDYGESLKYSEQIIYNRLKRTTGIFESYVTEGDGIRIASAEGSTVYDISGPNAEKQKEQFRNVVEELLTKI